MIFKQKNKEIVFEKKKQDSNKLDKSPLNYKKKDDSKDPKPVERLLKPKKKSIKSRQKERDSMEKRIKELMKKYNAVNLKLRELEKKDRKLERKNKQLEKNLKYLKAQSVIKNKIETKIETKHSDSIHEKISTDHKIKSKKLPSLLLDPFGINKKQEEFEHKIQILDERKKEFEELEAKLMEDRKNLDKRIAKFSNWKEKLIGLESEIEKRRKDVVEQEKNLMESIKSSPTKTIELDDSLKVTQDTSPSDSTAPQEDHHEIIDKIPQCAAIIQRGILKQINAPFAEMIGFETNEVMDKSLFDFIAPEGLGDIEKYYLSRLKGTNKSTYETVLSTKNDDKMAVEVNIKPTIYNGEKAEIAVVQKIENSSEVNALKNEDIEPPIEEKDNVSNESIDKKVETKPEKKAYPALSTQPSSDRIQEIINETQAQSGDKTLAKPEEKQEAEDASAGKKSQSEIDDIVKKTREKSESAFSTDEKQDQPKDTNPVEPEKKQETESTGAGKKSQNEINEIIKKMKEKEK